MGEPQAGQLTMGDVEGLEPTHFESPDLFEPTGQGEVQRWSADVGRGCRLEALGLNRGSDTLVVSLHGATNRKKFRLPRFEWLASLSTVECSSLYISDPLLDLSRELELGWYTGWPGFAGHYWIAEWARRVARDYGCTKVIFAGSSGGGMASLQAATYFSGSLALVFNPQTSIINYLVDGERDHAQRRYYQFVVPELLEDGWQSRHGTKDWTEPLGDVPSPLRRYSTPQSNYIFYVQNKNDYWHVKDHYTPFRGRLEETLGAQESAGRAKFVLYEGPDGHVVPTRGQYLEYLAAARNWLDGRLEQAAPTGRHADVQQ